MIGPHRRSELRVETTNQLHVRLHDAFTFACWLRSCPRVQSVTEQVNARPGVEP